MISALELHHVHFNGILHDEGHIVLGEKSRNRFNYLFQQQHAFTVYVLGMVASTFAYTLQVWPRAIQ